jgi:HD-like signal output (HDOD) protein
VTLPPSLDGLLHGAARERFLALPGSDQAHLVDVATRLAAAGGSDDLVTAGLIHDVGKSVPGITVRIPDRVAKVLLDAIAPGMRHRIAAQAAAPRIGKGVWVLCRHAGTGAALAQESGYPDRVVWLIAHHEEQGLDDAELEALQAIDSAGFPDEPG